jgi:hypothetical protein
MRNANRILFGKLEVKRVLGICRNKWKDNIKMDLRETAYDDLDLIHLVQDRGQGCCDNVDEHSGSIKDA